MAAGSMVVSYFKAVDPSKDQARTLLVLFLMCCFVTVAWQFPLTYLLLYPFMLISTVFHEFGHAFMCVVTGGTVTAILINPNESGLTQFQGGAACAIIPAGYLGSTIIGAILIFTGFSKRASRWTSIAVDIVLGLTLWWAEEWYTRVIAVLLVAALIGVFFWRDGGSVRWVVLLMGTIAALDSLENIARHTIFNYVPESDAVLFQRECGMLLPFWVFGLSWFVIAVGSIGLSVMAGIWVFK